MAYPNYSQRVQVEFSAITLLHEIKALQQITYLKLAWSFINVNPTKNAFFLTLINVTSA